jgi:hypothetical protein
MPASTLKLTPLSTGSLRKPTGLAAETEETTDIHQVTQ